MARSDSVMTVRDGQLILWGGYTQTIYGEGEDRYIVALNLPGLSVQCTVGEESNGVEPEGVGLWVEPIEL